MWSFAIPYLAICFVQDLVLFWLGLALFILQKTWNYIHVTKSNRYICFKLTILTPGTVVNCLCEVPLIVTVSCKDKHALLQYNTRTKKLCCSCGQRTGNECVHQKEYQRWLVDHDMDTTDEDEDESTSSSGSSFESISAEKIPYPLPGNLQQVRSLTFLKQCIIKILKSKYLSYFTQWRPVYVRYCMSCFWLINQVVHFGGWEHCVNVWWVTRSKSKVSRPLFSLGLVAGDMICFVVKSENLM